MTQTKEYFRQYYIKNKEYFKKYYIEHKEYFIKNKEAKSKYDKEYYKKNKARIMLRRVK